MKQLYALTMDVHARYRTEAHQHIKPRFNERFIMSLKSNNNCIFLDDKWNFLSISNAMKVQPIGFGCQIIVQNSPLNLFTRSSACPQAKQHYIAAVKYFFVRFL